MVSDSPGPTTVAAQPSSVSSKLSPAQIEFRDILEQNFLELVLLET